ncbi:MAG: phosphate ABC transporter substrate-binding protein PstS [Rhizobiales bacterium]|nr:phosphate ABC transporter substrate-binding protein PstS [Hyphomicrobiales bacterium]
MLGLVAPVAHAADISGAGSTFAFPIFSKWADLYKKETGNGLNYQSIGSGAGIKQIQAKTVTFGATDAPMTADELKKAGLVQWPMVMGGIVPVVNLDGIKPGELVLDGTVLANIFLGTIKKWDDAAIKKLNPSLTLPSTAITVVRRADGSGTTFNFTDYLSKVSNNWKADVGAGASVEWPVGVGAKGNDGVAGNVGQTKNAIGYVEYAYAKQNKMTHVNLVNKAGKTVSPTIAAFQSAAASADWANSPGYYQILTDQAGEQSWPITAATFILMQATPKDAEATAEAIKFFTWAFKSGDKSAEELDYIPMPDSVVGLIEKTWATQLKLK